VYVPDISFAAKRNSSKSMAQLRLDSRFCSFQIIWRKTNGHIRTGLLEATLSPRSIIQKHENWCP
jgi:hypothetical protein